MSRGIMLLNWIFQTASFSTSSVKKKGEIDLDAPFRLPVVIHTLLGKGKTSSDAKVQTLG